MTQGLAKGSLGQEMTGGQIVDRLSAGIPIENRIVNDPAITLMFPKRERSAIVFCSRKRAEFHSGRGRRASCNA